MLKKELKVFVSAPNEDKRHATWFPAMLQHLKDILYLLINSWISMELDLILQGIEEDEQESISTMNFLLKAQTIFHTKCKIHTF